MSLSVDLTTEKVGNRIRTNEPKCWRATEKSHNEREREKSAD